MSEAVKVSSLTVLGGPLNGTSFRLDQAIDEIMIGSDAGCSFALDLPGVSPIHARFWLDLDGAKVYDTRSPRGVYVNDDRVDGEAPVRDGDVLWLGAPGEPESVMIQCRLAPPPPPGAVQGLGPDEPIVIDDSAGFFVEEPGAPAAPAEVPEPPVEEFMMFDEGPAAVAAAEPDFASAEPDAFFLDEPAAPLPIPPPPAPPPAASAPIEEFIFEEPAPIPQPPPPAAPPKPPPAAPTPVAAPAPAPVAPKPAPAAKPVAPAPAPAAAPAPAPAPPEPAPAVAPPAARPAPPPRPPRPAPAAAAEPRPPRPAPAPASRPSLPKFAPIALGAVVLLAGGGYAVMRMLSAPGLEGVAPQRARIGETIAVTGQNFATAPSDNEVLFGDLPGRVVEAAPTRLKVEVPSVAMIPGRDGEVAVKVRVGSRETKAVKLAVYQAPRLHGVSPDVGLPGDEIVLAGAGWGTTVNVKFGTVPAEVVAITASSIHVKVPALEATPGTSFPVTVAVSADPSNPAPFMFGRLPLIASIAPRTASAGDVVTLSGRGFGAEAAHNEVRIGGVRALVAAASDGELRVSVPFVAGGEMPVEVRVVGKEDLAQSTLAVGAPADPVDFRFAVELVEGSSAADRAAVATALGPAFILAASGGKSAAERAEEAVKRLNAAAGPLKASREADIVARGLEGNPVLGLAGSTDALLQVTAEDAAAYYERQGGRGPVVTPARLAVWWEALARDLVVLLLRGEKPQRATALAADGRVLGDVFEAARRAGAFGVPRAVLAAARPALLASVRALGSRVPASVPQPAGAPSAPGASAAAIAPLTLERTWSGFELDDGVRKYLTVVFKGRGGTFAYEGGLSVSLPLWGVAPQKNGVRFGVEAGGRRRHYAAQWNGSRLTGTISTQEGGKGDLGTFELSPR